jgi:hypothetical protein
VQLPRLRLPLCHGVPGIYDPVHINRLIESGQTTLAALVPHLVEDYFLGNEMTRGRGTRRSRPSCTSAPGCPRRGPAAQLVFKTTFSEVEGRVEASPGVGPSLNILVQSDTYTTALRCYLLLEAGYVADPDTAYASFDT